MAASRACFSSDFSSTLRMPRPPPPATAFTYSGKPILSACPSSFLTSSEDSVEASTGTFALMAAALALTLSPASSRISAAGPTNAMPFSRAALARSGFSLRKP